MRQSKCGCFQSTEPKRRPWYYKRGSWTSWKPVSIGGDEWCRWTLVLGVGPLTGVLVIPLWECRGCEDCGHWVIDGRYFANVHRAHLEREANAPTPGGAA